MEIDRCSQSLRMGNKILVIGVDKKEAALVSCTLCDLRVKSKAVPSGSGKYSFHL